MGTIPGCGDTRLRPPGAGDAGRRPAVPCIAALLLRWGGRFSRRHRDCLPQQRDAGFDSSGRRPARAVHNGSRAGNPSCPRGHACRPRQGLPRLPDRLGALEGRHPGPSVRGLCTVHVRATPGGGAGPAAERAVLRAHLCGFRAAGASPAPDIPSAAPAHSDRSRPARRSVGPGTPPPPARTGSHRPFPPLRLTQTAERGPRSRPRSQGIWGDGRAKRQPGWRRRRLHRESPHRQGETAWLLPETPGTGRRLPRGIRPHRKSAPTPVKSRVPRYRRGDCDRMGFRS